jgi:hypothetical protein
MDEGGRIHDLRELARAHGLPIDEALESLERTLAPLPSPGAELRRLLEREAGKLMPISSAELPTVQAMPTPERVAWFHARRTEERRDRRAMRKAQRAARKRQRRAR